MKKILCTLKDKDFYERLLVAYQELKVRGEVIYSDQLNPDEIEDYSKLIIDKEQLTDVELLNKVIQRLGAGNVILITDGLNDETTKQFLFTGIHIHYENSPVYSLINKLEGLVSIDNAKKNLMESMSKSGQKFIAVTSAAGGVGKTTLTLSLADALSKKNKKVLLVDMSIYSDIASKLQIKHTNGLNNLISSILQNSDKGLSEKRTESLKNNIVRFEKKNLYFDVLFGLTPLNAEKISSEVIDEIIKLIRESDYEIVLFDTCSSVSEMSLALVECMDTVLVVSLPDIGNGWKLIKQKELYECIQVTEKCRLVINRYSKKSGFSGKQLERELQYPLLGVIPEDDQMMYYSNSGKLMSQYSQKVTGTYINYIAHQLEPVFGPAETKIRKIN